MWIERVVARAFGPFQNAILELRPGLTVVYGPNEAGKSSWLAATRLALTGVRRGRGSMTREAAEIERRHRPWDHPDIWQVETRLHLHDGRTIDISQDLAGKVACRAVDVALGEDVSAEITPTDGTPDAAIWLGIDRDAFAVTLAVSQAQILAVADDPAGLQEHMQRAAASAASDATAAVAIDRLAEFRRNAVGADTAAAKGPLRSAMRAVEETSRNLEDARRQHAAYLERQAKAEAASEREARAEAVLAAATLAAARQRADALAARAARAVELWARHPSPPAALAGGEEQAAAVAGALSAWRQRPIAAPPAPTRSPLEIEAELAEAAPSDADLAAAEAELTAARDDLAAIPVRSPSAPVPERGPLVLGIAGAVSLAAALLAAFAGVLWLSVVLAIAGLAAMGLAWSSVRSASSAATTSADDERRARADGRLAMAGESVRRAEATRAAEASRRKALQGELEAARAAAAMAASSAQSIAAAEALLRNAAESCGLDRTADPAELVAGLGAWQAHRLTALSDAERSIAEYQELLGLLDGGSLADLEAAAATAAEEGNRLSAATTQRPAGTPEVSETEARAALDAARHEAATLGGEARVIEESLPSVAEAEEAAAAARDRLARVEEVASIIDETLDLLRGAQTRVHHDLAPILKRTLDQWLPEVTGGTYLEAGINPADLSMEVKEAASGRWRDARYLSEGTREQIYLLLRVAMASHLVTTDEVAPLLLDEVTAQADADRRLRLLSMIRTLSAERQIVLFSHDAAVRDWAQAHLHPERDRLVELTPATAVVGIG